MERATRKDEHGRYYLTGDGIYGDRGVPEKYYGDDINAFGLIEDILGDTYDLDRLRELVEVNRQGRVKIYPKSENLTCGACGHFHRIAGTRRGTCDVKPFATTRRGASWGYEFMASQSRKACKMYKPDAEAALAKEGRK